MTDMQYEAPGSLKSAVALLAGARGSAKILAGGTDLLVQMRSDLISPKLIVDVKNIAEMRTIKADKKGFRIGAAVTGAEVMEHARLGKAWPGVTEAVAKIGSIQVKGRATVGGNLCNASPAADSVPALMAAGAKVTVIGPKGRRQVAIDKIATGPGKTSLKKGEIVVSIFLPKPPANSGDAYMRFTPRTEMDIAVVGVGVNLTVSRAGVCKAAKVALGAVAARAIYAPEAAKALIGTKLDDAALDAMAAAASAACRPIDDKRGTKEYRIKVAGVLARRTAKLAYERAC